MSRENYDALVKAPKDGSPLIFAFHGTGGDEHQFFSVTQQMMPGAGIVSPRGDVNERGAARFFKRTGEGVYDMDDLQSRTEKMAAYVRCFKDDYPDSAIFGFGYSNGANILAAVAIEHPDLFERIGLLHPLIPWEPEAVPVLAGKRVLITAGRSDPICPWPLSERLIRYFEMQGAAVETEIHNGGHELRQSEMTALNHLLVSSF